MAEQFVTSANGDTTLGYALYGSNTWNKGASNGACQGAYQGTTAAKSRVGVLVFSGAGNALRGKAIQQIVLSVTSASAGSSSNSKVLTLRKSRVQSMPTTQNGSDVVGDALGTLTGKFYGNTVSFTLNASSNAALFTALAAYFEGGNSVLVLYNGETSSGSGYSTNYARITTMTITVTYLSAFVWYNRGGTWIRCKVYYRNGGSWVQVQPYYRSGGSWVRV